MRTKRIALSWIVEIIPYFIIGFLGLIKYSVLINSLGSELNGYYDFINRIISYLFLVEAGFTSAVTFKLYKPFANDDKETIIKIYNGSKKIYRKIGLIIFALIFITCFLLPTVFGVKTHITEVIICFAIISCSYLLPFFCCSYSYSSVLFADQKKYVYSLITNIIRILCDILIIALVKMFPSLVTIAIIILVVKILEEVSTYIVGKKAYPWLKKSLEVDTSATEMTKDVFWHQLGYLIANNVDSILIMKFIGAVMVSVYGAYNYITSFLYTIMNRIAQVISHPFGNSFAKDDKKKTYKLFREYQVFMILLGVSIGLCYILGIRGFISLWVKDKTVNYLTDYINYFTVVLFGLNLFLSITCSMTLVTPITANGLYKDSKPFMFITSFINFVLSLLCIMAMPTVKLRVIGILLSTTIDITVSLFLRAHLVTKKVFTDIKMSKLLSTYIITIICFVLSAVLLYPVESFVMNNSTSYFKLILMLGISFIIIIAILSIVLKFTFKEFTNLVSRGKKLIMNVFKKRKVWYNLIMVRGCPNE